MKNTWWESLLVCSAFSQPFKCRNSYLASYFIKFTFWTKGSDCMPMSAIENWKSTDIWVNSNNLSQLKSLHLARIMPWVVPREYSRLPGSLYCVNGQSVLDSHLELTAPFMDPYIVVTLYVSPCLVKYTWLRHKHNAGWLEYEEN